MEELPVLSLMVLPSRDQRDRSLKMERLESGVNARDLILSWRWEPLLVKEMILEHQSKLIMPEITSLVTPCSTTGVPETSKSGSTSLLVLSWPRTSPLLFLLGWSPQRLSPLSSAPSQPKSLNSFLTCKMRTWALMTWTWAFRSKPQPWVTLGMWSLRVTWSTCTTQPLRQSLITLSPAAICLQVTCLVQEPSQALRRQGMDPWSSYAGEAKRSSSSAMERRESSLSMGMKLILQHMPRVQMDSLLASVIAEEKSCLPSPIQNSFERN